MTSRKPKRFFTSEEKQRIAWLYSNTTMSMEDIGRRYGVSGGAVRRYCTRIDSDIPPQPTVKRPQHE